MVSKNYIDIVKARNSTKNGKLKKLKRPPKWLFPLSPERQYFASLLKYTLEIRRVVTDVLYPKIPFWLAGGTITYPDPVFPDNQIPYLPSAFERTDSLIEDIINEINESMILIGELLLPSMRIAQESAKFFGLEIAAFNQIQYQKTIKSVLGIDIFLEEPYLIPQLELFANQNSQLISNMTIDEIERVSGYVQRAIQEGSSFESVAIEIEKSFGITRRHAKLIARDQTSKLNGSLTKLRQQEVGIKTYRWQTSDDERVRATHKPLNGKICRWDDPTVYFNEESQKWENRSKIGGTNVHTSVDVNCRCIPIPIIEGIFDGR